MCIGKPKIPPPKAAPSPPDKNAATFAAVNEQRAQRAAGVSRSDTLISRLSDNEAAAPANKKRLLGE